MFVCACICVHMCVHECVCGRVCQLNVCVRVCAYTRACACVPACVCTCIICVNACYASFYHLYYKRRSLYICTTKAPLLEGSGNRRLYPLKGTSFNRVYVVFGARVDLGFFAIRQKRIRGGSTYAECNSGSLKEHLLLGRPRHCLTATRG